MTDIIYEGEHLWPGWVGRAFVILAFVSAVYTLISFIQHFRYGNSLKQARTGFIIHAFSVFGIAATLMFLLSSGYFEYDYAWKHSNTQMPARYLFAAFWEGQEGSFILWMFWQALLGLVLLKKAKTWEPGVMIVVSLAQVFLASMLLGVFIGEHRIGSNPFLLMREMPENVGLPWTLIPDYINLPQFQEGRGLNPLLQNYWMTIHPPVLFLGFSLTLIPFAFALTGLWKKQLNEWMENARSWSFLSVAVLGLGILMGGAWAYEALSFGGFWAWDPVENASLVPWLLAVGGAHLILINKKKVNAVFSTFLLITGAYIFVLYSTFLTRSGILGDTSVHSFTDNGMTGQLLAYLLFFVFLFVVSMLQDLKNKRIYIIATLVLIPVMSFPVRGIVLFLLTSAFFLFWSYRKHFKQVAEESLWSREFWMFIGALTLCLSALQITFSTSVPVVNALLEPFAGVFNKLYDWTNWNGFQKMAAAQFAPPGNAIAHYNQWQIPFGVLVAFFIAISQHLKYKQNDLKKYFKSLLTAFLSAIIIACLTMVYMDFDTSHVSMIVLLFASVFAFISNVDYFVKVWKGRVNKAGSSLAHAGFSLILLGAVLSSGQSQKISANTSGIDVRKLNEEFKNQEEILLFKHDTLFMNPYFVSYQGKKKEGINLLYEVAFFDKLPNRYQKGDFAASGGQIYQCTAEHTPNEDFFQDEKYWQRVQKPSFSELKKARTWTAFSPGKKKFSLFPRIQLNPNFGNVPEPDTRHYLSHDIFTHVRWAELENPEQDPNGYLEFKSKEVKPGDTLYTSQTMVIFEGLRAVRGGEKEKHRLLESDVAALASIQIITADGREHGATPLYIIRDEGLVIPDVAENKEVKLKFAIENIMPDKGTISLAYAEHVDNRREFIVFQAIIFPWINILWIGCLLMVIGTLVAVKERVLNYRR